MEESSAAGNGRMALSGGGSCGPAGAGDRPARQARPPGRPGRRGGVGARDEQGGDAAHPVCIENITLTISRGGRLRESRIRYYWQQSQTQKSFRTGISLHSHTLHSRESMDFIGRVTANTPWLSGAIRKQQAKYRALKGRDLDLRRAWWTPPLSPIHLSGHGI